MAKVCVFGVGSPWVRDILDYKSDHPITFYYRSARSLSIFCDLANRSCFRKVPVNSSDLVKELNQYETLVLAINSENPLHLARDTRRLLDAAATAGVKKVILLSSLMACQYSGSSTLFNTILSFFSWNSYGAGKALQETIVERWVKRFESVTVYRIGLIWSPSSSWYQSLQGEILRDQAWVFRSDRNINVCTTRELFGAIDKTVSSSKRGFDLLELRSSEPQTWEEAYRAIAVSSGLNLRLDSLGLTAVSWWQGPRALRMVWPFSIVWVFMPQFLKRLVKLNLELILSTKTLKTISPSTRARAPIINVNKKITVSREIFELKKGM